MVYSFFFGAAAALAAKPTHTATTHNGCVL
jgi:hypothetical protein